MESNRGVTLTCLAGGIASLSAAIILNSPPFSLASAFFFFLTLLVWKYGYWLMPFITRGARIVEMHGPCEIPPAQDMVVKKTKSGYIASMFVGLSLNESASGKSDSQKALMMELFERALSSLRCVTKVCMLVDNVDLSDYIEQLKERRSLSESRLSQVQGKGERKGGEVARLEREVAYYTRQIEKLSGGEKPMQVVAYAMTSADGLTREEAVLRVRAQAQQVSAVLANALGGSACPLQGDAMRRCFEWEFSLPTSSSHLSDELF